MDSEQSNKDQREEANTDRDRTALILNGLLSSRTGGYLNDTAIKEAIEANEKIKKQYPIK